MKRFIGTSTNGDFNEALSLAIDVAKAVLSAEQIVWTLVGGEGVVGRFGGRADLTVEIVAGAPSHGSPALMPSAPPGSICFGS